MRREADRRHQVAKRAHRAPGRRGEALGADLPAHSEQPAKRHLQPCRALLRPHRQPGAQGRQDRLEEGRRDAVLDQGRVSEVQRGRHGQAALVPCLRAALLDGHTLRRAPGAHAVRLHAGELPASHQQVVPEPPRRGHRDRPQDAQVGAHDRHARLPARRDGGLHRAARRRCARRAPVRRDQALPGPRDGARVQGVWSEAHPRTRHTPQPCEPADRDGLLRAGHRRAHGPRGGGHHLPLRAPVPHEAGRDGRRARRSEGVRRMPCENSARKRNKTMAFRCTPEEHKLICEMAAWSGMLRQDYIIAKLTDTEVEVRPSVSMQKALKDSMVELAKEVKLAASYGELSDSLQQRLELVMRLFLALSEPIDAPAEEEPQTKAPSAVPKTPEAGADGDMSIFGMGRG